MPAILKRRFWCRAVVAAAALGSALGASPRAEAACTKAIGPSLRLMTYNASFQMGAPSAGGIIATVLFGPLAASSASSDTSVTYAMSDDKRIEEIVARILQDDPDVFALEEVNKGAAKDKLVDALRLVYPNFIRNVGSNADVELNNSGLMLFSKFKIVPNTNVHTGTPPSPSDFGFADVFVSGSQVDSQSNNVLANTVIFGDSASPDSWASKGVTVVRLTDDCASGAGTPFTVALTHMQATYEAHDPFDQGFENQQRLQQFEDVRFALSSSMTSTEMKSMPVFVLGDLNVNGMANAPNTFTADNGVMVPENHSEWAQTFGGVPPGSGANPSGLFFSCGGGTCTFDPSTNPSGSFLVDSWGFEMPSTDPGQTSPSGLSPIGGNWLTMAPDEGERIDYVLHNRPLSAIGSPNNLCLQYMKRGLEYISGASQNPQQEPPDKSAGVELSDHMPLLADFNLPAPRCSPFPLVQAGGRGPLELTWDPSGTPNLPPPDAITKITNPGSMQWYHLTQAGTYVITTPTNVRAAVYQEANLSVEITPSKSCTVTGGGVTPGTRTCKYSMPKPPYFIRAFGSNSDGTPDRTMTGTYSINVHQCRCGSVADSCLIDPATPDTEIWPASLLAPTDTMFFELETEHTGDGTPPKNTFTMSQTQDPPVVLTHSVVEADGTTVVPLDPAGSIPANQTTWASSGGVSSRTMKTTEGDMPGLNGLPARYFYTVHRSSPGVSFPMTVAFNTDLTYLQPATLQCIEERTIIGDDDVWGHFIPDGPAAISCGNANPDCVFIGVMNTDDDDEPSTPRGIVDGRLIKSYVTELDPQIWEDVFDTGDDFLFEHHPGTIAPLAVAVSSELPQHERYQEDDDLDHFEYQMVFARTHRKPDCRPTPGAPDYLNYCPSGTTCKPEGRCE